MLTSSVLRDDATGTSGHRGTGQQWLAGTLPGPAVQFHVLSFEGPDGYARAGGIATRITGLTEALANAGFETHLWFVGDPNLCGHETRGQLRLHRWCQWISRHHPGGVYDGEEGKRADYVSSLPPFLIRESLLPFLGQPRKRAVILAEEWQTVDAVLHLDSLLRLAGVRKRVAMFWNANNTFGFDRIPWSRLSEAAVITTVSRYMRQGMWGLGVDALVVPNGLSAEAFRAPERGAVREFRQRVRGRFVVAKVARWDPDKRWLLAIETVAELKRQGWRPLLVARGGVEEHGAEVLARAGAIGLRVAQRLQPQPGVQGLLDSLSELHDVDVLNLRSHLCSEACRVLFRAASAVLANSGHEPFGLVGLEAMAAGGLACTGSTGEDYAVPGWNALVLQTNDPREFVRHFHQLQRSPAEERAVRRRGTATAKRYTWPEIVGRNLVPHLHLVSDRPPWMRGVSAEQNPRVCRQSPGSHKGLDAGPLNGSNGHSGIR
jgi:glycosyltransferase involved in cell wall biosynthesis